MIQAIGSFGQAAGSSLAPATNRQAQPASPASGDTVTFSKEALAQSQTVQEQSQDASSSTETETNLWETRYGLKAGTVTLANGHKQKTSIKDGKMEIAEYDGTRLVRKETGIITNGMVIRDIDEFEKNGQLARRVHSELYGQKGGDSTHTSSKLHRSIQWFKSGKISKELEDDISVDVSYSSSAKLHGFEIGNEDTLEDIANTDTLDHISKSYSADIIEYNDQGKLFKKTSITQNAKADILTKRNPDLKKYGIKENVSEETSNKTEFSVLQETYDTKGQLVSQISFKDSAAKWISQSQELDVNLYNNGELVQYSHAEASTERSKGHYLSKRPTMLEALSLTDKEYSGGTPLGAQDILKEGKETQVETPSSPLSATLTSIADGSFNSAQSEGQGGADEGPHSSSWETTLYQDGKKTLTQKDSEVVQKNLLPDTTGFQTATGLTEDKDPTYVHGTTHSVETYDQRGVSAQQSRVSLQELAVNDARDITRTETKVSTMTAVGNERQNSEVMLEDTLDNVDLNKDAASQKAGKHMQMAIEGLLATFNNLKDSKASSTVGKLF